MSRLRHRHGLLVIASALVLIALLATSASGFDVLRQSQGRALRWPDRQVAVFVQAKPDGDLSIGAIHGAVARAIARWNNVGGSLLELVDGGLVDAPPGFDIYVSLGSTSALSADRSGRLALDADPWGELRRVEIRLDSQTWTFSRNGHAGSGPSLDLEGAVVHHLGHALGLAHSRLPEASMYFFDPGIEGRSLHADDERGLRWLYPATAPTDGGLCDACDGDGQCSAGTCVSWPSKDSYCVAPCQGHDDCPMGYSCGDWSAGKACLPNDRHCAPELAKSKFGDLCTSDLACPAPMFCWTGLGDGICAGPCSSTNGCGGGGQCVLFSGGGQNMALCMRLGGGAMGESCSTVSDCASLYCAPTMDGGGRCSSPCSDDQGCKGGSWCDGGNLCTSKGQLPVGWPCASGFDCQTGKCVAHPGGTFARACAMRCAVAADCPAGTGCTPSSDGSWCLPYGPPIQGGPCTAPGACGPGSLCDVGLLPGLGSCQTACDPFSATADCDAGKRCVWVGAASAKAGACRNSGGGKLGDEACSQLEPCRVDLLCAGSAGAGTCRRACNPDASAKEGTGCPPGEQCVQLDTTGETKPRRGVCSQQPGQLIEVPPVSETQGSNYAAQEFSLKSVVPWQEPEAPSNDDEEVVQEDGCGATRRGSGPWPIWLALALAAALIAARRHVPTR